MIRTLIFSEQMKTLEDDFRSKESLMRLPDQTVSGMGFKFSA